MAPRKKAEKVFVESVDDLALLAEEIGKELDNAPVTLDRGSYVEGTISFGSLVIDLLTGGGLPPGKFTVAYGPEGGSKSTCAGHLIAESLKRKVPVFFFDHETSSDAKYFRALGVRIRMSDGTKNPYFHYYQPNTAEDTYKTMARILRKLPDYTPLESGGRPAPSVLFVIDSVAAMLSGALEDNEDNNQAAFNASVHSRYLRLVKSKLGRKNASLFATNQIRVNPRQMFGSPEYEPGGNALKFYPDLKFRLSAVGSPFVERNRSMKFITIRTKKNKQFPPFLESAKETLAVAFGRGYERGRDSLGYLQLTGQIARSGKRREILMDGPWKGLPMYTPDLLKVLCSNKFRAACRSQLESDLAYSLFFKENDWDALYDFDEEAVEDSSIAEGAAIEGVAEIAALSSFDDEEVATPKSRKRRRKKKVPSDEVSVDTDTDSQSTSEVVLA